MKRGGEWDTRKGEREKGKMEGKRTGKERKPKGKQWCRNCGDRGYIVPPKFRTCTPCIPQVKDAAYVKILSKRRLKTKLKKTKLT